MKKIYKLFKIILIKDVIKNFFDGNNNIIYAIESSDWSIRWDGLQITHVIRNNNLAKADFRTTSVGLKNKIIHFGSINTFINKDGLRKIHKSNKIILTWFHVSPNDDRVKYIPELNQKIDLVHAACNTTKQELIKLGLYKDKIVVIPLGIDLKIFKQYSQVKKNKLKQNLNLPKNKIIIGSFQKDGNGWGDGLEPKLIKGPDIFCDCVERLAKKYDIHVLLTGPARGYVKNRLEKAGIDYTHKYLQSYLNIVKYYNCLDLYLITSRVEGGPKAILESWATGVPIVSAKIGMATDIIRNNENGILVDVCDVNGLVNGAIKILNNKELKNKLIKNSLEDVKNFNWSVIGNKYYSKLYSDLL